MKTLFHDEQANAHQGRPIQIVPKYLDPSKQNLQAPTISQNVLSRSEAALSRCEDPKNS